MDEKLSEEKKEQKGKKLHDIITEDPAERRANLKKALKNFFGIMLFAGIIAAVIVVFSHFNVHYLKRYDIRAEMPVYEPDAVCSVYIYMCGSNLESRQGLAGKNINELLKADIPENVNVILQTGGTKKWNSHDISADKLQRYIVKDNQLRLVEEADDASMGSPDTLSGFLKWGTEAYPADRNFVVLWDHGGSSAEGVCYDEKYNFDYLDRSELKSAFSASGTDGKFDMVIFDACYMGCIEIADTVQDYFRYMIASQKIVPGGGLDYTGFINAVSGNNDVELGKIICDSFFSKYEENNANEDVQLSFYDLEGTDQMISALDSAGKNLIVSEKTQNGRFKIVNAAMNSIIGNANEEINVVDMQIFMDKAIGIDLTDHYDEITLTKNALLPYQIKGKNTECTGVSMYYPLCYDKEQVEEYLELCPINSYGKLIENVYKSVPDKPVSFENAGSVNEDGRFEVSFGEESEPYIFSLSRRLWRESEKNPGRFELVGTDAVENYDIRFRKKASAYVIDDDFDGDWYHLDSHFLLTSATARRATTSVTAPVNVNGEDFNLSFVRPNSGSKHIHSLGRLEKGSDENGLNTRDVRILQEGDRVSVYSANDETGGFITPQEEFEETTEGGDLGYLPLPAGKYRMQYIANDIYGNSIYSNYAICEISGEDGDRKVEVTRVIQSAPVSNY